MSWIVVRNWEKFQHPDVLRSDTEPAWIKVYTRLLHNPDFDALTWQQRGILMTLWLEFGASDGQLPVTVLPQSGPRRVRAEALQALVDAGFIGLSASRPHKQSASPEKRREEKKTPLPPSGKKSQNNSHPEEPSPYAAHGKGPRTKAAENWVANGGHLHFLAVADRISYLMDEFRVSLEDAERMVGQA